MTVKNVTVGAIALMLVSTSVAQAQQTQTTTTVTTQTAMPPDYGELHHNIVSGAVGGVWGGDTDDGGWAFDGAYDYLYSEVIGFEFIGAFSPDFALTDFPLVEDSRVNAYMFNAIAALPIGRSANWLPFVSGGLGVFTIRDGRDDFELELDPDIEIDVDGNFNSPVDDNQFGGNLGVGIMGFRDQVGFRADIRYYTGMGNNEGDNDFVRNTYRDISYWRSTAGISFRW